MRVGIFPSLFADDCLLCLCVIVCAESNICVFVAPLYMCDLVFGDMCKSFHYPDSL